MHSDCLFCKIIAGEVPSYTVYEDDTVLAFLDIFPVRAGHVLVVPKVHVDEFQDMDDATYQTVMAQVHSIARKIKEVYQPQRVGMMVMGWDVPHAHIHVLPMEEKSDITSRIYLEGKQERALDEVLEEHRKLLGSM